MSISPRCSNGALQTKVQSAPAFLEKLYEILTDTSNSPFIAWQSDGTSFLIKKVSEFKTSRMKFYEDRCELGNLKLEYLQNKCI